MNDTKSNQLHCSMQAIYDRGQMAQSPKNYFPVVSEFVKELLTNPLLKNHFQDIKKMYTSDLEWNKKLQIKSFSLVEKTRTKLESLKEIFPGLVSAFEKYDDFKNKNSSINWELIFGLFELLHKIFELIILSHPIYSIDNLIAKIPNDAYQMLEDILTSYLDELDGIEKAITRKERTSLCYSVYFLTKIYRLYDFEVQQRLHNKLIQNNKHHTANNFILDTKDFDRAFELYNPQDAALLGFDVEEYKMHMQRVWTILEPNLLVKEKRCDSKKLRPETDRIFDYKYSSKNDIRIGIFSEAGTTKEELSGISSALFNLLIKNEKGIHWDRIGESIIDCTTRAQAKDARKTINNKLKKYFPEDITSSKNGILFINPLYRNCIRIKKK